MIYKSHAKVNLALDILGKDENGYHFVQTVLQKIPLFDEINIEKSLENSVVFKGEESGLIDNKNNTITKALEVLNPSGKYKITVQKNIPVGAGLGGGSSNAATVLNAINEIENLGLSKDSLRTFGAKIGMDVPFFIEPGTAVGRHYGEQIQVLPNLNLANFHMVLFIPRERKNTKKIYEKIDITICGEKKTDTGKMINILENGDKKPILDLIHNDFENVSKVPKIKNARTILCGSGTAFFAISNSPFDFEELSRELPHLRILDLRQ